MLGERWTGGRGMRLITPEPKINIGFDGFEGHDLLGRKVFGERLTALVDRIDDPMVIALDGAWGTGKSFFLKLWAGAHRSEFPGKATIIYFDAFQYDYLDDPLISLVGALHGAGKKAGLRIPPLRKLRTAAAKLAKPALRVGLAASMATATAGASALLAPVIEESLKASEAELEKAVDKFWALEAGRIAAMGQFRGALEALTQPKSKQDGLSKVVIVVDELDRCRPDFALSLLEVVKHFFAVPGVHFVLGANMLALETSVKARYGADADAFEYLQKFVHLRLNLPDTVPQAGTGRAAVEYFDRLREARGVKGNLYDDLRQILMLVGQRWQPSLRDIERIMTYEALFPRSLEQAGWGSALIAHSAVLMRVFPGNLYEKLRQGTLSLGDVEGFFGIRKGNGREHGGIGHQLWLAWARYLQMPPDPAVVEETRQAFSHRGGDISDQISYLLSIIFDTFKLPDDLI